MSTSDLTLSIIVIFIFISLYIFNILVVGIQRIKDNWPIYRCQPLVMPFAGVFGFNAGENFAYCIQNMQKGFMDSLLQPLRFNVSMLGDITGGLTSGLNVNRSFLAGFRTEISATFMNIFDVIFKVMVEAQRAVVNLKDVVGKLMGIMSTTLNVVNGSIMTMNSAWDGPPGKLVRAMCFHPETKVQMKNGEVISMKAIPLNSILKNGTRVCAVMQISNLDENDVIIEKMYKVKRTIDCANKEKDILVSGSHLIYYPDIKQFVHVKDLPLSELSEIDCDVLTCLITSDHTIPIGDWIFHDWEDNNGSESKQIGGNPLPHSKGKNPLPPL
jgi:hypothetical protein